MGTNPKFFNPLKNTMKFHVSFLAALMLTSDFVPCYASFILKIQKSACKKQKKVAVQKQPYQLPENIWVDKYPGFGAEEFITLDVEESDTIKVVKEKIETSSLRIPHQEQRLVAAHDKEQAFFVVLKTTFNGPHLADDTTLRNIQATKELLPPAWEEDVADENDADGRYKKGDDIYHYYEKAREPIAVSVLSEMSDEEKGSFLKPEKTTPNKPDDCPRTVIFPGRSSTSEEKRILYLVTMDSRRRLGNQ